MRTKGLRSIPVWLCLLSLVLTGITRLPGLVLCIAPGGHIAIEVAISGEACAGGCCEARAGAVQGGAKIGGLSDCDCVDVQLDAGSNATVAQNARAMDQIAPPTVIIDLSLQAPVLDDSDVVPATSHPPLLRWRHAMLCTVVLIL